MSLDFFLVLAGSASVLHRQDAKGRRKVYINVYSGSRCLTDRNERADVIV